MGFSLSPKAFTILVASLYMLYGLSKLLFILIIYTLPEHLIRQIPVLNLFIHRDHTVAGFMYEIVFGIFAIFSLLYGYALLFPQSPLKILMIPHLETTLMVILGLFLVIFYLLIIKTNLPIPKDPNYTKVYWYMGVGGGLSFIVFPILFELVVLLIPALSRLSRTMKALVILSAVVVTALVFGILIAKFYKPYYITKEEADEANPKP